MLVLGGALVWFLVGAINDLTGSLGSAQQGAVAYADALVDERWADAHALLCEGSRALITPEDLEEHYAGRDLTGYRITGINVSNHNGVESGQIGITFTTADGLDDTTSIPLTREGDDLRPCP